MAGGTALALQIGHRVSVDYDFFSSAEIPETILPKVKRVFNDFSVTPFINNKDELTVSVNNVKITFLYYPSPQFSHQRMTNQRYFQLKKLL